MWPWYRKIFSVLRIGPPLMKILSGFDMISGLQDRAGIAWYKERLCGSRLDVTAVNLD
jgi:hypothetical protein